MDPPPLKKITIWLDILQNIFVVLFFLDKFRDLGADIPHQLKVAQHLNKNYQSSIINHQSS